MKNALAAVAVAAVLAAIVFVAWHLRAWQCDGATHWWFCMLAR